MTKPTKATQLHKRAKSGAVKAWTHVKDNGLPDLLKFSRGPWSKKDQAFALLPWGEYRRLKAEVKELQRTILDPTWRKMEALKPTKGKR